MSFKAHRLDYSMFIYINRKFLSGRLMCVWAHSILDATGGQSVTLVAVVGKAAAAAVEVQAPAYSGIELRTTPVNAN